MRRRRKNPPCQKWSVKRQDDVMVARQEATEASSYGAQMKYRHLADVGKRLSRAWDAIEHCMAKLGVRECEASPASEAQYYRLDDGALVRSAEHFAIRAKSLRGVFVDLVIQSDGSIVMLSGVDMKRRYEWWDGYPPAGSDAAGARVAQCMRTLR